MVGPVHGHDLEKGADCLGLSSSIFAEIELEKGGDEFEVGLFLLLFFGYINASRPTYGLGSNGLGR